MEQIGSACIQSAIGVSSFVSPWVVFSDVVPVSIATTSELFLLYNVVGSPWMGSAHPKLL